MGGAANELFFMARNPAGLGGIQEVFFIAS